MSYIQGSKVRVIADFADVTSGLPITGVSEVVLTVEQPDDTVTVSKLSTGGVHADPDVPGRFYAVIDTAPAAGMWNYQFESTGADAIVARKQITVKARIPAPS